MTNLFLWPSSLPGLLIPCQLSRQRWESRERHLHHGHLQLLMRERERGRVQWGGWGGWGGRGRDSRRFFSYSLSGHMLARWHSSTQEAISKKEPARTHGKVQCYCKWEWYMCRDWLVLCSTRERLICHVCRYTQSRNLITFAKYGEDNFPSIGVNKRKECQWFWTIVRGANTTERLCRRCWHTHRTSKSMYK